MRKANVVITVKIYVPSSWYDTAYRATNRDRREQISDASKQVRYGQNLA